MPCCPLLPSRWIGLQKEKRFSGAPLAKIPGICQALPRRRPAPIAAAPSNTAIEPGPRFASGVRCDLPTPAHRRRIRARTASCSEAGESIRATTTLGNRESGMVARRRNAAALKPSATLPHAVAGGGPSSAPRLSLPARPGSGSGCHPLYSPGIATVIVEFSSSRYPGTQQPSDSLVSEQPDALRRGSGRRSRHRSRLQTISVCQRPRIVV